MTQKTTTYLATAVRYFANPSLRGNAQETPEMEQRTIGVLSGLQARLPLVVLRLDEQNHYDSQAVVVLEHGRQIAYLAADDAHQCVAEYGERLRVGIPVRVTEVNVEKHGVFWVKKPKMKGASSASSSVAFSSSSSASLSLPAALDWSGWMEPAALALPAAFRQRIESLELIIDFCLGEIEADEEGGDSSSEDMLCEYLGCWLEEVSFDVSREAHERVLRYRQLLEASGRPKLMEMAEKMDRALVKGGCIEVTRKRCEMWQQMMEDEGVKEDFDHLMAFSTSVPQVMLADTEMKVRQLPGRLYDFIADDAKFLSHLRYLMPPLCALRNILSYRLLRKLLCKKLGVSDAACRIAGNTDFSGSFSGSFSGCSSGSFSVSPRFLQYLLRVLLYLLRVLQYLLQVLQYLLRALLYHHLRLQYQSLKTGRRRGLVLLFIFRLFGERRLISSVWLMCFMNWGFLRIRMGFAAQRRRLSGRLEGR